MATVIVNRSSKEATLSRAVIKKSSIMFVNWRIVRFLKVEHRLCKS